jgi:hypothetical protein
MLNCLLWTSNLAALSWQPLVILSVERAWQTGGSRRIALAALAGAMQMLTGAPEIIVFTWLILGVLWLCKVCTNSVLFWPSIRRFAAIIVMVSGLAALQILPFLDLLDHSPRDSSYEDADGWPMPLWGFANFVVPQFRAAQSVLDTYQLHEQYWTKSYYVGVGVIILALVGVWRDRQLQTRLMIGATLVGLVLALGNGGVVYGWLKQIVPAIGFARYPIKFVALPVFAIPILAAYGFNSLQFSSIESSRRGQRLAFLLGGGFVLIAVIILWVAYSFSRPEESWPITWQSALSSLLFMIAIIALVCGFLRTQTIQLRKFLAFAIVVLVGLDLVVAAIRLHPTVTTRAFGPLELNLSHKPSLGSSRALVSQQANVLLARIRTSDRVAYCVGIRSALFRNNNLLEGIPKVDGFCSLPMKEQAEVFSILNYNSNSLAEPLADFLGVSQVSMGSNLFAWQSRSNFLPIVTAGQRPIFVKDSEILNAVGRSDFEPRREVYLPLSLMSELRVSNATEARILSSHWSPHYARFSVEAASPAMVVIAQSFYHNWRAFVDGQPVAIWRANHAFQALEVPEGRHEVTLIYKDRLFQIGVIISAVTLIVCLVFLTSKGGSYICKASV